MPKKEGPKKLSENIRRFLERKEEEERQKKQEAKERTDRLLELRRADKKSSRAMNSMLKMTKSSNKSVILETLHSTDTAATLAGRQQCDEDDYGYESSTARSLYDKLMKKYEGIKEEPKFPIFNRKAKASNLSKTIARVKNALDKGDDDTDHQTASKKIRQGTSSNMETLSQFETPSNSSQVKKSKRELEKEKARRKRLALANRLPKPQSFNDLITLAEKKSKVPTVSTFSSNKSVVDKEKNEVKTVKECEFERPMTRKEKEEYMRENRLKLGLIPSSKDCKNAVGKKSDKISSENRGEKILQSSQTVESKESLQRGTEERKSTNGLPRSNSPSNNNAALIAKSSSMPSSSHRSNIGGEKTPLGKTSSASVKNSKNSDNKIANSVANDNVNISKARPATSSPSSSNSAKVKKSAIVSSNYSRPSEERSRTQNKAKANQILSDDEDDDYDSEMDDFIDDSDAKMDISAEIRGIFGYDRRQYRDEDFDDRSMETNRFSDVMKEEARSAKIGLQEDLEDMRREEEEKRRRKQSKKVRGKR